MLTFRPTLGVVAFALAGCGGAVAAAPPPRAEAAPAPAAVASPTPSEAMLDAYQSRAVEIVRALHGPNRDEAYATFGAEFRAAVPLDKIRALTEAIDREVGALTDARYAEQEDLGPPGWKNVRVIAFFERGARVYTVGLDDQRVLRGLLVRNLSPKEDAPTDGPADDYQAKRDYALPARGAWAVVNGGRDKNGNGHVGNPQQWYAFDLVVKGSDGKSFTGDGKKVEDYLAFGKPVLAPADGTIVSVVDGVPDNAPGEQNGYVAPGNYVVIDHGDGEFSFLCHVERGSFKVKPGAKVRAGNELGKVGNSGNSSEPHIHWHLATDGRFEKGHGLPIRFARLLVNAKPVDHAEPRRDDVLEPAK